MYRYRTERFDIRLDVNLFPTEKEKYGDGLDEDVESDFPQLDDLLNRRAAEGWELVTYTHVAGKYTAIGHYLLTFRKEITEEEPCEERTCDDYSEI